MEWAGSVGCSRQGGCVKNHGDTEALGSDLSGLLNNKPGCLFGVTG